MIWKSVRPMVLPAIVLVMAAALQPVAVGHDRDDHSPLFVSRLTLVETRDVDRQFVDDTYRAEVRHLGPPASHDYADVSARLVHPFALPFPSYIRVIDGEVDFGTVRAGETVASRDTITIRRHRHQPQLRPEHLRWDISGRPDIVLSDAWAGEWRVTFTTTSPDTNQIVAIDIVSGTIGAGEPVGLSLLPEFTRCRWSDSDDRLEADCGARFQIAGCLADGAAHVVVERHGGSFEGHGQWNLTATGACGPASGSGRASIDITGVRVSEQAEPEPFSPGLLSTLVPMAAVANLLALQPVDAVGPPTSEEDCARGRWRRATHPSFKNARACRTFVSPHHEPGDEGRR